MTQGHFLVDALVDFRNDGKLLWPWSTTEHTSLLALKLGTQRNASGDTRHFHACQPFGHSLRAGSLRDIDEASLPVASMPPC